MMNDTTSTKKAAEGETNLLQRACTSEAARETTNKKDETVSVAVADPRIWIVAAIGVPVVSAEADATAKFPNLRTQTVAMTVALPQGPKVAAITTTPKMGVAMEKLQRFGGTVATATVILTSTTRQAATKTASRCTRNITTGMRRSKKSERKSKGGYAGAAAAAAAAVAVAAAAVAAALAAVAV